MKLICKILLPLFTFLGVGLISLLYLFPKSILMDKALTQAGVYLIPASVKEGLTEVVMKEVRVFRGNEELGKLDRAVLRLGLGGVSSYLACGKGEGRLGVSWGGDLRAEFKDFSCVSVIGSLNGKLRVEEGVFGKVSVKGLKVQGADVESIDLEFNGKTFKGDITYMGMKLSGGGELRLRRERLEDSEINATFKGSLGNLVIRGKLKSPQIRVR